MTDNNEPRTLPEAVIYFANPDNCLAFLASRHWPDGVVVCPRCGSKDVGFIASRHVWQCKTRHIRSQFNDRCRSVQRTVKQVVGKRLKYAVLTAKDEKMSKTG